MRILLILVGAMTLVTNNMKYPETKRDAVVDDVHGVKIPDPYRWLEDRRSPRSRRGWRRRTSWRAGFLAQLPGRDKLIARLKELLYLETLLAAGALGGRYFYTRRHKDKEKAIVLLEGGRRRRRARAHRFRTR